MNGLALGIALWQAAAATSPAARVSDLMERGRYEEAARAAEAAGLAARAGDAWLAIGRWEEADAAFLRAAAGRDSLAARFGQARLLELRGRRAEARRGYQRFVTTYNRAGRLRADELTAIGAAVERLATAQPELARDALRAYDEAIAADSGALEPRLRAAGLLLARYNGAEARQAFEEILRRARGQPLALLGIARTRRFLGDADPVAPAESALARNPSLVPAQVFLAELALERDDWAAAARYVDAALRTNRRDPDALAVSAALAVVRGDSAGFAAADAALRADDPRAAGHFIAAADAAARVRRYADAARLAEIAVRRDSAAWRGWALFGANLLRRGEMAHGRAALETAFRGDPFDLWTKNTLDLLDTLDRYPVTTSPRFRFVIDAKESAVLTTYFAPLAEEAYTRLAERYGFAPPVPVRIEVFPTHADFSVRTVGLAGIGALGVCFGPVIAMDSPSARDRGAFSWGSTLWHEIAHVFHLERSRYRVPRWFTEGLAVLEERRARQGWGDEANPRFLLAFAEGNLPPLSRLNDGFLRPGSAEGISHAYLLASYAAEWLEARYGPAIFTRMLDAYARGLDHRTIADSVLGAPAATLDTAFQDWMRQRFGERIGSVEEFGRALTFANEALRERRLDQARDAFERAKRLFPEYAGPDSPYRGLARIHALRGHRTAAAAELTRVLATDETAYDAAVELAEHLDAVGRPEEAAAAREAAMYISPFDPAVHEQLAAHYTRAGRTTLAVRERRAILALRPADRAGAWFRLAEALVAAGDTAEARRAVLRALETAPGYAAAQDLLLRLQESRP